MSRHEPQILSSDECDWLFSAIKRGGRYVQVREMFEQREVSNLNHRPARGRDVLAVSMGFRGAQWRMPTVEEAARDLQTWFRGKSVTGRNINLRRSGKWN